MLPKAIQKQIQKHYMFYTKINCAIVLYFKCNVYHTIKNILSIVWLKKVNNKQHIKWTCAVAY